MAVIWERILLVMQRSKPNASNVGNANKVYNGLMVCCRTEETRGDQDAMSET